MKMVDVIDLDFNKALKLSHEMLIESLIWIILGDCHGLKRKRVVHTE